MPENPFTRAAEDYTPDGELPRYYVWVELPRKPDFDDGGEQPIDWTRHRDGGKL